MDQSLFYILDYIGRLTKIPFTVQLARKRKQYIPPKEVVISPLFFRSAACVGCGSCCKVPCIYTASDVQIIDNIISGQASSEYFYDLSSVRELRFNLLQKDLIVNEQLKHWWAYPLSDTKKCSLRQQDGKCSIHAVKPVNCMLPHICIGYSSKNQVASLTKHGFGFRWISDCKTVFRQFDAKELTWDLLVLKHLQRTANDLGIDTYLSEIIDWLEPLEPWASLGFEIPKKNIKIFPAENIKTDFQKFFE